MSKKLVLAEKPSVGKEIGRVLNCKINKNGYMEGDKYIVTWALGHLVTLADPDIYDKKYANWNLDDLPIMPPYLKLVVIKQSGRQFTTVKKLLERKDVDEVIIATDAGREGELVARWILDKSGDKKKIKRLWISSVTDKAIKDGFKNLKDGRSYDNLYKAAVARAEGDWLVGINATRALTTKHNASLSCGRVQTPTLAMIAAREEEIRRFNPKKYYGMDADIRDVKFQWKDKKNKDTKTFNKEWLEKVYADISSKDAVVISVEKKNKKSYSPQLYDLTELQRDAHSRYGYTAKHTLSIMQGLYERHKVLTYPRTDSRYLTSDIVDTIPERLRAINVDTYRAHAFKLSKTTIKATKNFVDDNKVSDHHAIIPTEESPRLNSFSYEERNIYEMVVKRFLAVLMPPFEYEETKVEVKISEELFEAKGKKVISYGFKELDKETERLSVIPDFAKGQKIKPDWIKITEGQTAPPAYFNEGTLLTAMENPTRYMEDTSKELKEIIGDTGGLGTVATRADIIEKLFSTNLVEEKGKNIHITKKGKQLLEIAPEELKSPKLTAQWEKKLSQIEKGSLSGKEFQKEIREYTKNIIEDIKKSDHKFKHDNLTSTKCPSCGKLMMEVKTRHGKSLVCQDRECGERKSISRVTNARCPECHKKLELRGSEDNKVFVCKCGYKEKLSSFEKRKKEKGNSGGKKDYINYMKEQKKKEEKEDQENNVFAALKGLNLK